MTSGFKSPDDVALAMAGGCLRSLYALFRISPLSVQFYPVFAVVLFSSAAFLYMSATADPLYVVVSAMCAIWSFRFRRYQSGLVADSKKEWSADLYRKYGAKAEALRTGAAGARMVILFAAIAVTVVGFGDMSEEIRRLEVWQKALFPIDIWALAFTAYCQSCELPTPGDGDFFTSNGRVSRGAA